MQGTMTHMAPETLTKGHISKASDVYAFGILMWELYSGMWACTSNNNRNGKQCETNRMSWVESMH
jgi:serine/threonine protein kinase